MPTGAFVRKWLATIPKTASAIHFQIWELWMVLHVVIRLGAWTRNVFTTKELRLMRVSCIVCKIKLINKFKIVRAKKEYLHLINYVLFVHEQICRQLNWIGHPTFEGSCLMGDQKQRINFNNKPYFCPDLLKKPDFCRYEFFSKLCCETCANYKGKKSRG